MIGKTIGKYRFVEELGRDGMGAVYKALDETLDREVAVKMLHQDVTDTEIMNRFQAEAATLARLNHPDIVGIHEFQKTDDGWLMVMELVRGETLEQLAARGGPLPPERAAYLVSQVLGALQHAHSAGIVHRDLKPTNIMVTEHGGVKVKDFGLARMASAEQMTSDGFQLGSPAYMAPERLAGQDVDGRADVYSAGVIFYMLLTGHVPFEAPTPLEMVQKQLTGTATPASAFRPDLPGWCQAILDRALVRQVADRFPTADAFREALLAAISESTESTGAFALPPAAPVDNDDDVTRLLAVPAAEPVPTTDPATVASWAPPIETMPTPLPVQPAWRPTTAAPASAGTTVVLKKNQFAAVGGLLVALLIGVAVLAYLALRRPNQIVTTPPAQEAAAAAPVASPPANPPATPAPTAPEPTAAPASATPAPVAPATNNATSAPIRIDAPPLVLPASPSASAPSSRPSASAANPVTPPPPTRPGVVTTPFKFEARAVVADGDKRRERETTVVLADGNVTVSEKNAKPLYVVALDAVVSLTYSNSRQPLWNSPDGPAEAMRVEGGAFGFFKGGRNNWFGIRTNESLLVLRVDDDVVNAVTAGLQSHTGLTLQRLVERKD